MEVSEVTLGFLRGSVELQTTRCARRSSLSLYGCNLTGPSVGHAEMRLDSARQSIRFSHDMLANSQIGRLR